MKKIYLLFLLLTTIVSCQKDEINNKNSELPDQKVRLTSIDFKDLPYFILNSVEDYSKVNEAQISNIFGEINRKIPVKKISMPSGAVSYTFILNNFQQKKNEEESYHFDNLIIKQSKKQSLQIYIVRYTPAQEWLNNGHNFGNYIGQISIYNGNGLFISTESYPQNQETSDTNKTECALEFDRAEWSCSGIEGSMDPGDCHWIYYYDLHCTGGGGTSTDGTSNDPNPNEPGGFSSEPSEPGGGGSPSPDWSKDTVLLDDFSGPEITNIADYVKCFDESSGAVFTIYADQPTPNSSTAWSGITDPDVGHTFISIQQNGVTRIIGFYPKEGVNPFYRPESSRELVNDSGHHFDVSVSKNISSSQLSSLLNGLKNDNTLYNLNSYNCTDFGIRMASKAGLNIGSCYGSWPGGGGDNPGQLGQTLRSSSINGIKNVNGGNAPTNSGNCN